MSTTRTSILAAIMACASLLLSPAVASAAPAAGLGPGRPMGEPTPRAAMARASADARAVRQRTSVPELTTETQSVTANPSGTYTVTTNVRPVRVRRGSAWVPLDATLRRSPDGTFAPAASSSALALSGGGSGPLATATTGGVSLSLSWPWPLPAPAVAGPTATYRSVLPGVDLVVTATTEGGFGEVLVVRDARAAADPRLAAIDLPVAVTGGRLQEQPDGGLAAAGADGHVWFSAPAPRMWDAGAAVAPVAAHAHGGVLTLTPDRVLLTSPGTRFPVSIDPTWTPHFANGAKQHYEMVQQGSPCNNTSFYDSTDPEYQRLGVGLQDFSGCLGIERAFYQVAVPSIVYGASVVSATVDVVEVYSATCASTKYGVDLWWTATINPKTNWFTQPRFIQKLSTVSFGPAANANFGCTAQPHGGFDVTATMASAASGRWPNFTFGLRASNEGNDVQFKRFADNPSVEIEYNFPPATPSHLNAQAGGASLGCATSTPYPLVGRTASVTPPTLSATVSDPDGDALAGVFTYWLDGSTTTGTLTADNVTSGQAAAVSIPASFIAGLSNGQTIDWDASATDGRDSSPTTAVCHFTVAPNAPDPPAIASADGSFPPAASGTGKPAGTPGSFTITAAAGDAAVQFVWGLDAVPPTGGAPASQVLAVTAGAATLSGLVPPSPGPHTLFAYALDAAGNESSTAGYQFIAAGDQPVAYTSLAAAFDDTMVSDDGGMGAANADGSGASLSAQDLRAAGWTPGGTVTVDGAALTLPGFGAGQPDNVLAANQTIAMNGATGSALVILATSTNAFWPAPGAVAGDVTSPNVAAGATVTGTGCTLVNSMATDCAPASGTIQYSGAPQQSYFLTVPDWVTGPWDVAALSLPHLNTPLGQQTHDTHLYAFAVPLNPNAPVASVTLPDVSNRLLPNTPGLHVLAMAVRNPTAAPGGQTWTGAWASPIEGMAPPAGGGTWGNQTFRIGLKPSIGGGTVRVKLSNPGFTTYTGGGAAPLSIADASIATQYAGVLPAAAPVGLTFGGSKSVTIPEGGEVTSDPLAFTVTAGQSLLVSFALANASLTALPEHTWAGAAGEWVTPPGSGDHVMDTDQAAWNAFTASGSQSLTATNVLTDVDVATAGAATVAVLGDHLVDTDVASTSASQTSVRVADDLAAAVQGSSTAAGKFGVIGEGIESNLLAQSGFFAVGGVSVLARLDRDVLDQPGIGTVVVDMGLQDLVRGATPEGLESAGLAPLIAELQAWGITVVLASQTPCDGYAKCTAGVDAARTALNGWLSGQTTFLAPLVSFADFDAAVAVDDPSSTATPPEQRLNSAVAPKDFDAGDHVNLTNDGYAAIAGVLGAGQLAADMPPGY